MIVGALVLILPFLFGRNYSLKDRTPNLWKLASDLKSRDTKLYDRFAELEEFFTINLRHVNSKRVESALLPLDYAKVKIVDEDHTRSMALVLQLVLHQTWRW